MDDAVAWIIIAAFYAPLHYLLPVLVLFITGGEAEGMRQRLVRRALLDSTWSMLAAFALAIYLTAQGRMPTAMFVLLLSMTLPYLRIWRHRREITAERRLR